MFAIAFDLVVADTLRHHPRSVTQAYADIGTVRTRHDFVRAQGSVYRSRNEDLADLTLAVNALHVFAWLPKSVRDSRAFRIEQWSDFTPLMKS